MRAAREESATGAGHRRWRAPALLFLAAFAVYAVTIARSQVSTDVYGANWTSWKLISSGSPWVDGAHVAVLDHHTTSLVAIIQTSNGHTAFGRFPGVIVAALPAYALAGSAHMTSTPGSLTAAFLCAMALSLMFSALRAHLGTRTAMVAAVTFGFATPMWSVAANAMWPHTITLVGIAGMAWAANSRRWWWVGVFGGITLWGRLHAAVIVAVLGVALSWRRRDLSILVRIGVASGLLLVGMCAWVRWMYGTWNPLGAYGSSGVSETATQYWLDLPNQLGMWIAPDRGILVWTPVILLLAPAVVRSWRGLPDWSRSLLWGGLAYTVLECALNTFTGGDIFYGYRYGLEMLGCATPVLALSSPAMGRVARRVIGPLLGLQFLAIALGSVNDGVGLPQEDVWHHNAFVHVVHQTGTAGWVLVALFVALGAVAGHFWSAGTTPGVAVTSPDAITSDAH